MPLTFPFGRYKGKPIEVVLKDENYCRWLLRDCDFFTKIDPKLRDIIKNSTQICGVCNNDERGMYAGEGDYIRCPACGNRNTSQSRAKNHL